MVMIGITSAYRTVSYTSINVIAGLAPIELQLKQIYLTKKIKSDNNQGKITGKQTKLKIKVI